VQLAVRPGSYQNVQIARSLQIAIVWSLAVIALVPAIMVHDLTVGLAGFTLTLFLMAMAGAPLWAAAIDIPPNYAGWSTALMNVAGAVAGIMSPVVFGSVRLLRWSVTIRNRLDQLDSTGPPDRGRSRRRPFCRGRRIEPAVQATHIKTSSLVKPPDIN
jgi:hypothetical protein